ncbi:MAG: hypothetical protein U0R71_06760 [Solirubrobacterales bacterium]
MIRQARTYLVGAMSGATLIAVAIVAFVLLVTAQVFEAWPVAALGGGEDQGQVSEARVVPGSGVAPARAGAGSGAAAAAAAPTGAAAAGAAPGSGRGGAGGGSQPQESSFAGSPEGSVGSEGSGGSGGSGGSAGSGNTGGSGGNPTQPSGGSGGGGSSASSTSTRVSETVNTTVSGVDEEVLGGALQESGVTEATESVVNGVAGPESVVGQTVDETVKAAGGLLGGKP